MVSHWRRQHFNNYHNLDHYEVSPVFRLIIQLLETFTNKRTQNPPCCIECLFIELVLGFREIH